MRIVRASVVIVTVRVRVRVLVFVRVFVFVRVRVFVRVFVFVLLLVLVHVFVFVFVFVTVRVRVRVLVRVLVLALLRVHQGRNRGALGSPSAYSTTRVDVGQRSPRCAARPIPTSTDVDSGYIELTDQLRRATPWSFHRCVW